MNTEECINYLPGPGKEMPARCISADSIFWSKREPVVNRVPQPVVNVLSFITHFGQVGINSYLFKIDIELGRQWQVQCNTMAV